VMALSIFRICPTSPADAKLSLHLFSLTSGHARRA
jgi:hypothetical protein